MRASSVSSLAGPAVLALLLACSAVATAQTTTLPCPSSTSKNSTNVAGGYQNVDLGTATDADIIAIGVAANASFNQWLEMNANAAAPCNESDIDPSYDFGIVQVCRQVVAGTNYGIQMLVTFDCAPNDDTLAEENVVLNAIVYEPLTNSNDATPTAQVVSVSQTPGYQVEGVVFQAVPASELVGAPAASVAAAPNSRLRGFGSLDGL